MSAKKHMFHSAPEYVYEEIYELEYDENDEIAGHVPHEYFGDEHSPIPIHKLDYEFFEEGQAPVSKEHEATINKQRCSQFKCKSQDQMAFCVPLSFDQVLVPGTGGVLIPLSKVSANVDNIRGVLKLKFNSSLSKLAYAIYIFNATCNDNQIISSNLHVGGASSNGPVAVNLFNGPPLNVNGRLTKGLIDNKSIESLVIEGVNAINSVASLYQAIREGALYANVTSQQHPDGVVRGQIYLKNSYVSNSI